MLFRSIHIDYRIIKIHIPDFDVNKTVLADASRKKKCGLDVGENFNLSKSDNARQPQCTPEKEDAIMQAFRHFGII